MGRGFAIAKGRGVLSEFVTVWHHLRTGRGVRSNSAILLAAAAVTWQLGILYGWMIIAFRIAKSAKHGAFVDVAR